MIQNRTYRNAFDPALESFDRNRYLPDNFAVDDDLMVWHLCRQACLLIRAQDDGAPEAEMGEGAQTVPLETLADVENGADSDVEHPRVPEGRHAAAALDQVLLSVSKSEKIRHFRKWVMGSMWRKVML